MAGSRQLDLVDHQGGATDGTRQWLISQRLQEPVAPRERRARPYLIAVAAGPRHGGDVRRAARRLVEAIVKDIPLVAGPDMLEDPQEELPLRGREGLLLPVPVLLLHPRYPLPILG